MMAAAEGGHVGILRWTTRTDCPRGNPSALKQRFLQEELKLCGRYQSFSLNGNWYHVKVGFSARRA